jgi:phosphatidylglycerol---prolipoprotein diacylglyceryl transferase
VPFAVIALDFDPVLRFGATAVRLETLALAGAVFVTLLVTALIARVTPAEEFDVGTKLHVDDLVLLTLAVLPGAVAGGRIGYALLHLDYYLANPGAFLDPQLGSFELMFAVLGGAVTGSFAAGLISEDAATWRDVGAIPTLLGITLGKFAMALGGRGQGAATDANWATAYTGPGPWASLAPAVPSHPSQLYEALGVLVVAGVILIALAARWQRRRAPGTLFLVAVAGLAVVRAVIAATWRDSPVVGPIVAEQLLCAGVLLTCVALARWPRRRIRRVAARSAAATPPVARPPGG